MTSGLSLNSVAIDAAATFDENGFTAIEKFNDGETVTERNIDVTPEGGRPMLFRVQVVHLEPVYSAKRLADDE